MKIQEYRKERQFTFTPEPHGSGFCRSKAIIIPKILRSQRIASPNCAYVCAYIAPELTHLAVALAHTIRSNAAPSQP